MKRNFSVFGIAMEDSVHKKVALVERNPAPNGLPLVSTIAVAKRAPNDLVELAMEIQKANDFVNTTACSKLSVIAEQVHFLHNQAQKILQEAKRNLELHETACNFKKIPGNTYYLYVRPSGQKYFSMLSPQEWINHPHEFLGGYRLEADQSWTSEYDIPQRNKENVTINQILASKTSKPSVTFGIEEMEM